MKTNVYLEIVLRIALLGLIGMMWTFIPENLREFFDDTWIEKYGRMRWVWGSRHYWYSWTMGLIFIVTLLNLAFSIRRVLMNNYDTRNWF